MARRSGQGTHGGWPCPPRVAVADTQQAPMAETRKACRTGCWPRVVPRLLLGLLMTMLHVGAAESCWGATPEKAAARAPGARGQPDQDPAAPWLQRREVVPASVLYTAEDPAPRVDPSGRSWQRWLSADNFCVHCGRPAQARGGSCFFLLLGFAGQGLFGLRFLVQWLASERAHAVVIPESFWWISITAGLLTLVYAASILAWPILLGQGLNFVIYGRNLYFFRRGQGPCVTN